MLTRRILLGDAPLPDCAELVRRGRERARAVQVVPGAFLTHYGVASEAEYKRRAMAGCRIMQHAQIGFREFEKSRRAWAEIYEVCARENVRVDRYGVCLDWSMGLPRDRRRTVSAGTGLILDSPEDFARLASAAPVAPHFGDFVMGLPAAVENTEAALLAGATAIGNLGQYFTFRLPHWDDDVATTAATVEALALVAAQEREVLVHSNVDDGFAALFTDLATVIGLVAVEKYIVEDLLGARVSHCWGHHFSDPLRRLAFHLALARVSDTPGTMIYGNTTSYRGSAGENHASLASYLLTDIVGQAVRPSGHAVNPVPVTENTRIPDTNEIIAAQLFAARLATHAKGWQPLIDVAAAEALAETIVTAGGQVRANVLAGLAAAGIDTANPLEMLMALKRLGARRIEDLWGAGPRDLAPPGKRRPLVEASLVEEIRALADQRLARVTPADRDAFARLAPTVIVATTDVHEHGKLALEVALGELGAQLIDGGVSVDADDLADTVRASGGQAVLVSTYNGIALDYVRALKLALGPNGVPILVGGRLNQVPAGSNTSLPMDVSGQLESEGAIVCREIEDAVPSLLRLLGRPRMTTFLTIGVIGVGHLVRHMMPMLVTGGHRFLLSARNRDTAADLSKRFGLEVVEDNAEIVARADVVIFAVRPYDAVSVAGGLAWRADMTVLSLIAGVASADLAPAVAPARLVMAMPTVASEFAESATTMFPEDGTCRAILEPCGPVIGLDGEGQFVPASAVACYFGWLHELMDEMTRWAAGRGMSEDAARRLIAQTTRSAATVVRERRDTPIAEITAAIATPRSFTLLGLEELRRKDAIRPWADTAERLTRRLSGADDAS